MISKGQLKVLSSAFFFTVLVMLFTPAYAQSEKERVEEEKLNRYLNCLCRCYGGWASHIGVWYDPEEKVKPECESSGPCIGGIGAFGCSRRHFFGPPNKCAKKCYEGVYGKGSYDEKIADKIRREANEKFKTHTNHKIKEGVND